MRHTISIPWTRGYSATSTIRKRIGCCRRARDEEDGAGVDTSVDAARTSACATSLPEFFEMAMKRAIIFALLLVLAVGFAAPHFEIDLFRPKIARALERGLGRRVEVGPVH